MMKIRLLFLFTTFSLAVLISCKKDTLKFSKIEKLDSHTQDNLTAITFEGNNGYICGGIRFDNACILTSNDGGNTWKYTNLPQAGKILNGITVNHQGHIYACGVDGKLVWSEDKGISWKFSQLGNWQPYKEIAFSSKGNIIGLIGVSYNSGGIGYIDNNGSLIRWDSVGVEYNDIEMIGTTGYISGYGVILKSTNDGTSWDILDVKNDNFTAIHVVNENEVWACGSGGSILHTNDGGVKWEILRNGNDLTKARYYLRDIIFINAKEGWAVGDNGLVIYTDDAGKHWMEYERFSSEMLRSIALLEDGGLLVCGDNGSLYKLSRN